MARSFLFGGLRPLGVWRLASMQTLVPLALAVLLGGGLLTDVAGQQSSIPPGKTTPLNPARPVRYRDVLVAGLRARTPSELAFVNSVVVAVNEGRIPSRLVDQTFFWARGRAGNNYYGRPQRPIIYFIPALEARLKRLHLNVQLEGGLP